MDCCHKVSGLVNTKPIGNTDVSVPVVTTGAVVPVVTVTGLTTFCSVVSSDVIPFWNDAIFCWSIFVLKIFWNPLSNHDLNVSLFVVHCAAAIPLVIFADTFVICWDSNAIPVSSLAPMTLEQLKR